MRLERLHKRIGCFEGGDGPGRGSGCEITRKWEEWLKGGKKCCICHPSSEKSSSPLEEGEEATGTPKRRREQKSQETGVAGDPSVPFSKPKEKKSFSKEKLVGVISKSGLAVEDISPQTGSREGPRRGRKHEGPQAEGGSFPGRASQQRTSRGCWQQGQQLQERGNVGKMLTLDVSLLGQSPLGHFPPHPRYPNANKFTRKKKLSSGLFVVLREQNIPHGRKACPLTHHSLSRKSLISVSPRSRKSL